MPRQKITTFLWYDTQAEEAARFYVSLFPDSGIDGVVPGPTGAPMTVSFHLAGVPLIALNGGPHFKFTEAVSFVVNCETQQEVDQYWAKLTEGGQEVQCGWLKDKYGLSWQIVPTVMVEMIKDKDAARSQRVVNAMMQMKKLDIARLQEAYAQK
jgi:predicted 3-demethylubiquinone-9 3-methyltransferase (glyoxalase superfamily)